MRSKNNNGNSKNQTDTVIRVRVPHREDGEVIAAVDSKLGGRHLKLKCMDGSVRMGRIPGSMKKRRRTWINEGDIVIAVPWDFQDSKADVVWKYTMSQAKWLERNGYLK